MNILFLDQYTQLGGAQQCLLDLLPAIQQQGWHAEVLAPRDGPLFDQARMLEMPCRRLLSFPAAAATADLLYVNGPRLLPLAALVRRPVVFHAHSVVGPRWARNIAAWALRAAAAEVIAVSEFAAAPLRSFVPDQRIRVVYNGVQDL